MDGWVPPPDLEEAGDAADTHRKAFGEKLMAEDRIQYHTVGLQLGERYETSPVICADDSPAPPDPPPPDPWDSYTPLDRPGARAPHFWLEKDRALFDEAGQGFTLLDFGAAEGAAALTRAAQAKGMPVKVLRLATAPDDLYRHKLVLIRPDQHIAWHGDAVGDAAAVIDRVRGA
jgi:hypothetical protein